MQLILIKIIAGKAMTRGCSIYCSHNKLRNNIIKREYKVNRAGKSTIVTIALQKFHSLLRSAFYHPGTIK